MLNKEPIVPNAVYSMPEASKLLGFHSVTLSKKAKKGILKATKFGNKWKMMGQDLIDYINGKTIAYSK